jgi:hypothetical protein
MKYIIQKPDLIATASPLLHLTRIGVVDIDKGTSLLHRCLNYDYKNIIVD